MTAEPQEPRPLDYQATPHGFAPNAWSAPAAPVAQEPPARCPDTACAFKPGHEGRCAHFSTPPEGSYVRMTDPAPGGAQEPADPPWLTEAIEAGGSKYNFGWSLPYDEQYDGGWADYGWAESADRVIRVALPILRAGIAAEIEASIGNVAGESHAYCEGKRDAADIVRGQW